LVGGQWGSVILGGLEIYKFVIFGGIGNFGE